jgi:hypothetical protein
MRKMIGMGALASLALAGVAFAGGPTGDVQKDKAEAQKLFKEAAAKDNQAKNDEQAADKLRQQAEQDDAAAQGLKREAKKLRREAWAYLKDAKKEETEAVEAWDAYLNEEYWAGVYTNRAKYWRGREGTSKKNLSDDQAALGAEQARKPQNAAVVAGIQTEINTDNAQIKEFDGNAAKNEQLAAAAKQRGD